MVEDTCSQQKVGEKWGPSRGLALRIAVTMITEDGLVPIFRAICLKEAIDLLAMVRQ